jgi:hypothetical protein
MHVRVASRYTQYTMVSCTCRAVKRARSCSATVVNSICLTTLCAALCVGTRVCDDVHTARVESGGSIYGTVATVHNTTVADSTADQGGGGIAVAATLKATTLLVANCSGTVLTIALCCTLLLCKYTSSFIATASNHLHAGTVTATAT